jgi:aminoglycoside phosphotransferase (APT) family kinase protein
MPGTGTHQDDQATVVAWIEKNIGPVRKVVRQGRWRPAWFVTAEKDGKPIEFYVRGDRAAHFPPMPLKYEADVMVVFGESGIKVPKVYGFIESVPAVVLGLVPGRPNMATADSDAARARLREQLADEMRKIHAIDPAKLIKLGAPMSDDPKEVSLLNYRQAENLYLESDRLPSPDIEFVRAWINRNAPACMEGPAVITVDAGQFLFEGDKLTCMLDFELACVGDRHVDMAALRTRDRFEEIGDLESFYDLYEKCGGIKLDRDRIAFQWVTFALLTPLQVAHYLAHPEEGAQYNQWFGSHLHLMDDCIKDIARIKKVKLAPYTVPEPRPDRHSLLFQALGSVIENLPAGDEYEAYRRFDLSVAMKFMQDQTARRGAFEREYLDDVEALTGQRPKDAWDGDVQLEAFVQTAKPELEERILNVLYRRNERARQILAKHHARRRPGKEMKASD